MTKQKKLSQTVRQITQRTDEIRRGDIYFADLSGLEHSRGSEQTGRRPVLIIQNDIANRHAPTTIVAVLTSRRKRFLPTHVQLRHFAGLEKRSTVCLEQIKTIDKSRLEEYRGNIGVEAMKKIEKAMAVSLGTDGGKKQRVTER
ncbi:MAG: type II toxin-antitoxin system PemK/MazF family toxin [Ruminococcus sp.]|nr:type II toxin-antitoxin system PemK/MazF family toxin [Ruminococcus sp.]MCM1154391.1 type II toxin-antitoxin system PemK/MazF family toxin [Roseburia sp.]